mmetsp:Transcript_37726/g.59715  ORF Transcript_37726/g.59715 Transcript_37726/m.59715 type:complete len:229 (+) Transcript_37726:56-742(+)
MSSVPLFVADSLDAWTQPDSSQHNGFLLERPELCKQWNIQAEIDDCAPDTERFDTGRFEVTNGDPQDLLRSLQAAADAIVAKASLPEGISQQIQEDICAIGSIVGQVCPNEKRIQIKLETMGEGVCSRWHRDYYVGRAIVTYNSHATQYTADSNVDFWELENCGNNKCIIRDTNEIRSIGVGDILFMKGAMFPNCTGLVHKSPEVKYHEDGRVINRLVLKVDVPAPED